MPDCTMGLARLILAGVLPDNSAARSIDTTFSEGVSMELPIDGLLLPAYPGFLGGFFASVDSGSGNFAGTTFFCSIDGVAGRDLIPLRQRSKQFPPPPPWRERAIAGREPVVTDKESPLGFS
jgi:hypothetical protein